MSSSPSEKKSSNVEMGETNSVLPTPAMHEATPTFIVGFLSFKERLSRCSAEKEGGRIQPEVPAILSFPAMSTSAGGNKSPGDAMPLAESAVVPVQVRRKEIVLGLPASSAAPLTKSHKSTGAATETVKKRRCTAGSEGEPSGPLSQHRAKFVSLIDGMLSDCGSEIERSTRGLAESREALKQAEAALKSTEAARAAELSQLEVRVSDLERDLGKSASALFKLKKEKKSKASEVRRLQREIQNREESRTVVSRDDFHARLTRMAVLFDSLMAVHEKDLALASVEGSLNEIHLLKGDMVPTLDSEETRLLSRKEELKASDGDFDSILSQLEVSAQPSGSSTTPVPAPKEEKATELMPPPLDRKEIVLGLPASNAAPLTKSRKRIGAATETVKKRRCTAGAEGEPSGPLSQHRAKFVSLIDGMISDCRSEIERSTRGLAESREALKQAEAALKSTEAARAAELSQLEVWVRDLERDLGKSTSALLKLKKEKKSKASKVRRLQREIHN
ncbi:hypothetical protein DY000_02042960 [Brassica cretica]|uniref:Uncharacterized protein n=1 Tax=Brassica cretica TaxID=69181 RepID=A0ABQ7B9Q8_BRACR|nr:hypothetical protein DY000_02042960 [Brassica cretica]